MDFMLWKWDALIIFVLNRFNGERRLPYQMMLWLNCTWGWKLLNMFWGTNTKIIREEIDTSISNIYKNILLKAIEHSTLS